MPRARRKRWSGKAVKTHKRSALVISSKIYRPISDNTNDRGLSRKHIMESIDRTLRHFDTDYIDIYYCHRFDTKTRLEETVQAMNDLIRHGKVHCWGTSEWSAAH